MTAVDRIALVGLPGSGKTLLAPVLADRLGWACVDTDAAVEEAAGMSVAEVIDGQGEPAFRALERDALERALTRRQVVIACGGGLMAQPGIADRLLGSALVVAVDAPDAVLLERVGKARDRPLLRDDPAARLAELRRQREPAHARAHLRLTTEPYVPDAIVDRIATGLDRWVRIDVPGHPYHVVITTGVAAAVPLHLPATASRVAVVTDRSVIDLGRAVVRRVRAAGVAAHLIALPGGEGVKSWAVAGRLLERFARLGLGRRDGVVAVGGGTVGDLCGFAAAAYLRGIAWINVPTTLLAMVDSAVGGKTGVNLREGKNLAGAFWQPRAVLCELGTIRTLPDRAFRAAFSEIVKYAMIGDRVSATRLDACLPALLRRDREALAEVVRDSCAAKGEVVAGDTREAGTRAVLNYGHTAGHALEAVTGYGDALWHGEAVALGMRVAGQLSIDRLGCPSADIDWQNDMLARCGLGRSLVASVDDVVDRMRGDKKAVAREPRWVLLERRGRPRTGVAVPEPEVRAVLTPVLAA